MRSSGIVPASISADNANTSSVRVTQCVAVGLPRARGARSQRVEVRQRVLIEHDLQRPLRQGVASHWSHPLPHPGSGDVPCGRVVVGWGGVRHPGDAVACEPTRCGGEIACGLVWKTVTARSSRSGFAALTRGNKGGRARACGIRYIKGVALGARPFAHWCACARLGVWPGL